jgi:hypothetical protein
MTQQHPITPPPELVQQWGHDANLSGVPHNNEHWAYEQNIATCAAQWGYEQHEKMLLDAMHSVVPQPYEPEAE